MIPSYEESKTTSKLRPPVEGALVKRAGWAGGGRAPPAGRRAPPPRALTPCTAPQEDPRAPASPGSGDVAERGLLFHRLVHLRREAGHEQRGVDLPRGHRVHGDVVRTERPREPPGHRD